MSVQKVVGFYYLNSSLLVLRGNLFHFERNTAFINKRRKGLPAVVKVYWSFGTTSMFSVGVDVYIVKGSEQYLDAQLVFKGPAQIVDTGHVGSFD